MSTIQDLRKKYYKLIAPLDMELLFSFVLKKPRESILAHPEHKMTKNQELRIKTYVKRRLKNEPIAYILGYKEFYNLNFKVSKNTLIPRPETELMVDLALEEVSKHLRKRLRTINVVDVGTGSGNIITALAYNMEHKPWNNANLYGIDISKKALVIAKENATKYKLNKKIKFIQGNLLKPILKEKKYIIHSTPYIILANLPYLSSRVYASATKDVKLYEPKTALFSPQNGLEHYIKLLTQIDKCSMPHVTCYMEISPEQKPSLQKIIKHILPSAKITFHKDLAQKWRICKIEI